MIRFTVTSNWKILFVWEDDYIFVSYIYRSVAGTCDPGPLLLRVFTGFCCIR